MKKHLLLLYMFFSCALFLFSQTAAEMDILLETDAVTVQTAARFVLGSVALLRLELSGAAAENAAYEDAVSRGWVKSGPEDAIGLQEMAYLIMNAFGLKGGIMYSLLHNPRYAYREMIYRRIIQGRTNANMKVSGQRFLLIIGKALNYAGEREFMDSVLAGSGVTD